MNPTLNPVAAPIWRRLLGASLDLFVLALLRLLLEALALPALDRLLILPVVTTMLAFFLVFSCTVLWGRTPGQVALGLRTVDAAGERPGQARALARSLLLAPLLAVPLDVVDMESPLHVAGSVLFTMFQFASLASLILDRGARRPLHDLLAGTAVARADRPAAGLAAAPGASPAALLAAGVGGVALCGLLYALALPGPRATPDPARQEIAAALEARVREVPGVLEVEIQRIYTCESAFERTLAVSYDWPEAEAARRADLLCDPQRRGVTPTLTVRVVSGTDPAAVLRVAVAALAEREKPEPLDDWHILVLGGGFEAVELRPGWVAERRAAGGG